MAKKYLKKYLPKASGAVAVAMAMSAVLSVPAQALEMDENLPADIPPVEAGTESNVTMNNVVWVPTDTNAAIEASNDYTADKNDEVDDKNQQIDQDNDVVAENNEKKSNGKLENPDLNLPVAPELPDTDGMDAEGYNEAVGDYNENVDDYNKAVDDYNEGVDDYNAAADEYDQQVREQYKEDKAAYDKAKADYEEALKQYEEAVRQYVNNVVAYEQYQKALANYEAALMEYEANLIAYNAAKDQHDADTAAYEWYQEALADYEAALKEYEANLIAYNAAKDQHDADAAAYEQYRKDLEDYEAAKENHDNAVEDYTTESKIYDEVTDYNEQVKADNDDVDAKNAALEEDLHAGNVDNIDDVGETNSKVDLGENSESILEILNGYNDLTAQYNALQAAAAALDAHAGKNAALGSPAYAEYLAAVEAYNQQVTAYNKAVDAYNDAVAQYNNAVDTYNETKQDEPSDSNTEDGTQQAGTGIDWGNVNTTKDFDHIDVKYAAAASKDVTVDDEGNASYSDSVTRYTITGVYASESDYEAQKDSNWKTYSVSYITDSNSTVRTYNVTKDNANHEFSNSSHSGANVDPMEGKISFYVTLTDSNGKEHGITVNLEADSVYVEGSYYKAESNDFLKDYVDKDGKGLEIVTIDDVGYYDVSGKSVFLISALTCDGMSRSGGGRDRLGTSSTSTLNPDGLDLVLNLQTMIELHQSENAQKISYLGYELGKTAQADAPIDPGEAPKAPDDVPNPGEFTQDEPKEPAAPDPVPIPGEFTQNEPEEPAAPEKVADPGVPPTDPGEAPAAAPDYPAETERMDRAEKLEKLTEKVIVVIPEPDAPIDPPAPEPPEEEGVPSTLDDDVPVPEDDDLPETPGDDVPVQEDDDLPETPDDNVPVPEDDGLPETPDEDVPVPEDDGLSEIPDEDVPLAEAPKTGDASMLFGAMNLFSLGGILMLKKKKKRTDSEQD